MIETPCTPATHSSLTAPLADPVVWRAGFVALVVLGLSALKSSVVTIRTLKQRWINCMQRPRATWNNGAWERLSRTGEGWKPRRTVPGQQATLDLALSPAQASASVQAVATLDRFISHPVQPGDRLRPYMKGIVNFNEDRALRSPRRAGCSEREFSRPRVMACYLPPPVSSLESGTRPMPACHQLHHQHAGPTRGMARYYFNRKAYGCGWRAQKCGDLFQTAPAVEEALYLMAESYDKLGLPTQLRDDARRVLAKSFPDSVLPCRSGARDKPWKVLGRPTGCQSKPPPTSLLGKSGVSGAGLRGRPWLLAWY